MKLDRAELVGCLDIVRPALGPADVVPVYECICFDGEYVFAHDGRISIRQPFMTDFVGAVHGAQLIAFLKSVGAAIIDAVVKDTSLHLTAGRSRLRLPILGADLFAFDWGALDGGTALELDDRFVDALGVALLTSETADSDPWRDGVTLDVQPESRALIYSTNVRAGTMLSIDHTGAKLPRGGLQMRMPYGFCNNALSIVRDCKETPLLVVSDDWIRFDLPSGVSIFTGRTEPVMVDRYESVFAEYTKPPKTVPKPVGFDAMLERAIGLTAWSDEITFRVTKKVGQSKLVVELGSSFSFRDSVVISMNQPEFAGTMLVGSFLKSVTLAADRLWFDNKAKRIILRPKDGDGVILVQMKKDT